MTSSLAHQDRGQRLPPGSECHASIRKRLRGGVGKGKERLCWTVLRRGGDWSFRCKIFPTLLRSLGFEIEISDQGGSIPAPFFAPAERIQRKDTLFDSLWGKHFRGPRLPTSPLRALRWVSRFRPGRGFGIRRCTVRVYGYIVLFMYYIWVGLEDFQS